MNLVKCCLSQICNYPGLLVNSANIVHQVLSLLG